MASTRTAPSTPIRAIASTLVTRSAPSVPPASQAYEPLVKSLFVARLRSVILWLAVAAWLNVNIWVSWQTVSIYQHVLSLFSLSYGLAVVLFTAIQWGLVAVPTLVLHKLFLADHKARGASPAATLKSAFARPSSKVALAVYLLSSIGALVVHVGLAYTFEQNSKGDPKLTVFVKSRKHPHYLNPRTLFLILVQSVTAVAFMARNAMVDRFAFQWSHAVNLQPPTLYFGILASSLTAAVFATLSTTVASFALAAGRLVLPLILKIPIISLLLRPFVAHFARGSWTLLLPFFHFPLLVRAWALAYSTFVIWEISSCFFENIVNETAAVSSLSPDANIAVISGVTSSNRIFKLYAYVELRNLAVDSSKTASTRRTALFGDQKSSLNLWSVLARQSLLLLGEDYQLLLRRGQPPSPPVSPTPIAFTPVAPVIGTPTPLLRQPIFRSSVRGSPGQGALDALASDGPLAKAVDAGAEATQIPELFRSAETHVLAAPLAVEVKKDVDQVVTVGSRVKQNLWKAITTQVARLVPDGAKVFSEDVMNWWQKDRVHKVVENVLPFKELDVVVIDVLSYLVCASLREDQYGIVQRDIPKILEAILTFQSAVDQYRSQLEADAVKKQSSDGLSEKEREELLAEVAQIEKGADVLRGVSDAMKEGVVRIVRTFGDRLLAFRFPPRIAHKLQPFLEYHVTVEA